MLQCANDYDNKSKSTLNRIIDRVITCSLRTPLWPHNGIIIWKYLNNHATCVNIFGSWETWESVNTIYAKLNNQCLSLIKSHSKCAPCIINHMQIINRFTRASLFFCVTGARFYCRGVAEIYIFRLAIVTIFAFPFQTFYRCESRCATDPWGAQQTLPSQKQCWNCTRKGCGWLCVRRVRGVWHRVCFCFQKLTLGFGWIEGNG